MRRVVIVTGLSGAGRSSALRILEDLGFEAVDNLPMGLLERLVGDPDTLSGDLAVGIDSRSRAFDAAELVRLSDRLRRGQAEVVLMFMEADRETLIRRFSETRRRHPLARERPVADALAHERQLMAPLREAADLVVETSRMSLPQLRERLREVFAPARAPLPLLTLLSFAYRGGLPREADVVVDVRFLRNPHWVPELRARSGRDPEVGRYIREDPRFAPFERRLLELLGLLLPAYRQEGKSHLTVALGCTGGRHRSVFVVERLARRLDGCGWRVVVWHRDLPAGEAAVEVHAG